MLLSLAMASPLASSSVAIPMSEAPLMLVAMQRLRAEFSSGDATKLLPELASVHAAPSKTHGMGLMANALLPVGTVVSLYPVDAIGEDDPATGLVNTIALPEDMKTTGGSHRLYLPHSGCRGICVDANPSRVPVSGWLAHYVNDGAAMSPDDDSPAAVQDYLEASMAKENCILIPFGSAPLIACLTVRAVPAGAELLTTYGPSFWIGRRLQADGLEASVASRRTQRLRELEAAVVEPAMRKHAEAAAALSIGLAGCLVQLE